MIIGIDASKSAMENRTGVENFVYQVILNLQKIDSKNLYYLYTNKPLPKELVKNNFREKLIPFPFMWNKLRLSFQLLKDKPNVYFQPVYMIPLFAPKKSVGVFHDLAWKFFPDAYSKEEIFLQKRALNNLTNKAKKIICVSDSTKNDLAKIKPETKSRLASIVLSGNAFFQPVKGDPQAIIKDLDKKYFISLGRLEDRKNTIGILEAFKLAKEKKDFDYKLVLVGKPGHGYEKILRFLEKETELAKDIIIPGFLENKQLNILISNSLGFVFPSLYEGFGLAVVDAMKCGAPVITSDTSSLPEVVDDAALLVDPKKFEEIAKAMIQLAGDKNLRQKLAEKSLKQADKFSWEKTAGDILKILEEI